MAKKNNSASNKIFNLIIAVVMIGVIGLAAYAVYTTVSERIMEEKIASGEIETTLDRMAEDAQLSIDEFLEKYGIADAGLTKNSKESEVINKMKLSAYAEYANTSVDGILAETFLEGKATGDTLYEDFVKMFTVRTAVGGDEEQLKQMKELYGLDDSVTMDTLWSDVEAIIAQKTAEMTEQSKEATEDAQQAE